jgi:glycosyltransferase involved in cell wall biosynthesis
MVALEKLLADPGLRTRMGEAGRARVAELFSWTAIGARTVEVYRRRIEAVSTR